MLIGSRRGGARASSLFFVECGRPSGKRSARAQLRAVLCLSTVLCVAAIGCSHEAEDRRREFSKISWSVRMVSGAEPKKKSLNIEHLKSLPCQYYCDFRDGCAGAYEQHQRGFAALRRAKRLVSESMDDDEEALELLDSAERDLGEARQKTLACHDLQTKLKRRLTR